MNEDTQDFIIELMVETIQKLRMQLEATRHSRDTWMANYDKLEEELKQLKKKKGTNWQVVPPAKRGRPAKKRGPGRPKGSKTKVRK